MSDAEFPGDWSNPIVVAAGERQNIPAAELLPSRRDLWQSRIDVQLQLMQSGVVRRTPILVTPTGVIVDGHHAIRVVADLGLTVEVLIEDLGIRPVGKRIQELSIHSR